MKILPTLSAGFDGLLQDSPNRYCYWGASWRARILWPFGLALTRPAVGVKVGCDQHGHVTVWNREGHELTAVVHPESFAHRRVMYVHLAWRL
jgi:hypothetical protein